MEGSTAATVNETKHTKGPLRTVTHAGTGDVGIVAPGPHTVIAECFAEFWKKGDIRQDECAANAAYLVGCWNACELAAIVNPEAVPELVRVLRSCVDQLKAVEHRLSPMTCGVIALGEAALAKATGKEAR